MIKKFSVAFAGFIVSFVVLFAFVIKTIENLVEEMDFDLEDDD